MIYKALESTNESGHITASEPKWGRRLSMLKADITAQCVQVASANPRYVSKRGGGEA